MRKTAWLRAMALLFAATTVAAACSSDDTDTETDDTEASTDEGATEEESTEDTEAPAEEEGDAAGDLSGEIVVSGSSTVEPISIAVGEAYKAEQPGVNVAVSGPGTGDGFKLFCAGETDISDASRAIKDEEAAECEAAGINYVELKVGIDGLAVVTSADNADVTCLNFADLYALVGPEATGVGNWSDAAALAGELGSTTELPDAELVISAPGAESGTYDSFIEIALADIAEERGQADDVTRVDYSSAADDNVIIETVSTNPTSFGWVGYAFADLAEGVKLLEVAEGIDGECVAPTPETIASNEYPMARDLFIYVNTDKAAENPALADFVTFYMEHGLDNSVAEADYVPLTDDAKAEARSAWEGR